LKTPRRQSGGAPVAVSLPVVWPSTVASAKVCAPAHQLLCRQAARPFKTLDQRQCAFGEDTTALTFEAV
jgi:hypothetical protein